MQYNRPVSHLIGERISLTIVKVYEVDPLVCSRCGSVMRVVAVIMDPVEVDKILRHLIKTGRALPGLRKPLKT